MKKAHFTRLALFGMSALCAPLVPAQTTQERINDTKQAVTDYVFLRQQIAEAKNEWRVYQEVTTRRIEFFQEEIERLEGEISRSDETRSSAEIVIAERRATISELEGANNIVAASMPGLETRLTGISEYFPTPLKDRVKPLLDQLGKPRQAAQRMALVIGIMNEVDKFNSSWESASEQVDNLIVTTLYMGLAGGFYASADGSMGGYLVPAKGEWTKVPDNEAAPRIALAIKYYNSEIKPAELVPLKLEATTISFGQ